MKDDRDQKAATPIERYSVFYITSRVREFLSLDIHTFNILQFIDETSSIM